MSDPEIRIRRIEAQRDRARAERDRYEQIIAELRAELERQTRLADYRAVVIGGIIDAVSLAGYDEINPDVPAFIETLKATLDRYREALQRLRDGEWGNRHVNGIAREALEETNDAR